MIFFSTFSNLYFMYRNPYNNILHRNSLYSVNVMKTKDKFLKKW